MGSATSTLLSSQSCTPEPSTHRNIDVDELFGWLRHLDIDTCSAEMLNHVMAATVPIRGWLDVVDARIRNRRRELIERNLHESQDPDPPADHNPDPPPDSGQPPPEPDPPLPPVPGLRPGAGHGGDSIDDSAGVGHGEGRRRDARSRVIRRFAGLEDLLAQGIITTEHVDVISRSLADLDPRVDTLVDGCAVEILEVARSSTAPRLRRFMTRLISRLSSKAGVDLPRRRRPSTLRHWTDRSTGRGKILAELTPDDYQRFQTALATAGAHIAGTTTDLSTDERAAAALLALLGASDDAAIGLRVVAHLGIVVDAQTLAEGVHAESLCEYTDGTPLNPGDLGRLACTADRTEITVSGGVPLNVGRTRRLATAAQHRAIEAIHSTCAVGQCSVPITMCELHHIHHWEHGGRTDLDNLIPLCSYHHHRAHEQQWAITLAADRSVTIACDVHGHRSEYTSVPDRVAC